MNLNKSMNKSFIDHPSVLNEAKDTSKTNDLSSQIFDPKNYMVYCNSPTTSTFFYSIIKS